MKLYHKLTVKGDICGYAGEFTCIEAVESDGSVHCINDRGFKKGDIVEEYYSDEGHEWAVERVILNGKEIYGIEDMKRRLETANERHFAFMSKTLKAKGINHPVYNPE